MKIRVKRALPKRLPARIAAGDGRPRAAMTSADDVPPWPDLVLIDGGLGQLDAARETLSALGITDVPLIGVAKGLDRDAGRETFFMPDRAAIPAAATRPDPLFRRAVARRGASFRDRIAPGAEKA